MTDLIERLRGADPLKLSLYTEAADELMRLKKHGDSLAMALGNAMRDIERLQRDNEELRKAYDAILKQKNNAVSDLFSMKAALKAMREVE